MMNIHKFKKINCNIGTDELILVRAYQLFYNKQPDFSFSETHDEVQIMAYMLNGHSILGATYPFELCDGAPESRILLNITAKLIPFADTIDIGDFDLSTQKKKKIKMIAAEINKYLEEYNNIGIMDIFRKMRKAEIEKKFYKGVLPDRPLFTKEQIEGSVAIMKILVKSNKYTN